MRQTPALFAFNRGKVSPLGIARVDQKRVALSAETFTNWICRALGPMSLRPGWAYLGSTKSNAAARFLKFIFSTTDTALIELTDVLMRVWVSDALITRPSVSTAITNGTFGSDITGWTDSDEAGGTSAWVTGGYMGLTGNGTAAAIRDQTVTVAAADQNVEHALRIVVNRGPVTLRVGSTSGGDEYVSETELGTGIHSLAFTPTGNFYVRLMSRHNRLIRVDSCTVEASGVMEITTPWAAADLSKVRYDQSGDIVFTACAGYQQRKIERRATRSWSLVLYAPEDGPFRVENTGATTLTASAISGNITLTASAALFKYTHVGALFRHVSTGQTVAAAVTSAAATWSSAIRVTGVGASSRTFTINISNTWTGTMTLQRSIDSDAGPWSNVSTYTANTTTTLNDGLDNQIVYYRIGAAAAGWASGTADVSLVYASGSVTGVARITDYSSATSVSAEVLTALGGTTAVDTWSEGAWSDRRGWPTAVRFHEGRLWWAGKNGIFGSISDAFDGFDPDYEGDAAPINRTIGAGPVDTINWILSMQRMILGAQGAEFSVRSSSLDEPLTPTNFNMKPASTQGSSAVEPARIDQRGVYVDRSGIKVYELAFDGQSYDYNSIDMTALVPENGYPGIVRLDIQRKPDTRIHCVRSDGTVAMAVFDKTEDVLAWFDLETDGDVEDVVTLPGANGSVEDQVYYVVKRTINGSTVRYLEKWASELDCRGGTLNLQGDSFVTYSGSATTAITGLSHLEGESVVVWADGADVGTNEATSPWSQTYTVSGGQITLATAASSVMVGLPATGQWKSSKLGLQQSAAATILNQQKRLSHIGLVLAWAHAHGLRFGPDFDNLDNMPDIEQGKLVTGMRSAYDEQEIEFGGVWESNLRLCLQAQFPRPCTVLGVAVDMEIHD